MAIGDPYINTSDYQAIVGAIDGGSNAAILSDLTAVSRWVDRKLGRFFNQDATPTVRYFTVPPGRRAPPLDWAESENPYRWGNYQRVLQVDDIASSNGLVIKIDEHNTGNFSAINALNTSDYILTPENAPLGPEARPWESITIPDYSSQGGFRARCRVQVTAVWGWPSIPPAIRRAVADITAIMRTGTSRGLQANNGVAKMSVSGGLSIDYGSSAVDKVAEQNDRLVADLMREYGRAKRYL